MGTMTNSELFIFSVEFATAIPCEVTFNCFKHATEHTTVQRVKTAVKKHRDLLKKRSFEFKEKHSLHIYM